MRMCETSKERSEMLGKGSQKLNVLNWCELLHKKELVSMWLFHLTNANVNLLIRKLIHYRICLLGVGATRTGWLGFARHLLHPAWSVPSGVGISCTKYFVKLRIRRHVHSYTPLVLADPCRTHLLTAKSGFFPFQRGTPVYVTVRCYKKIQPTRRWIVVEELSS